MSYNNAITIIKAPYDIETSKGVIKKNSNVTINDFRIDNTGTAYIKVCSNDKATIVVADSYTELLNYGWDI